MFKHLFKMIWNRKRENALVLIELVTAFLVIFFIAAEAAHNWWLYRQPLGFEYQDTYEIRIGGLAGDWSEQDGESLHQVLGAVRSHDLVEWAHVAHMGPFRNWQWTSDVTHDGRVVDSMFNQFTDGAPQDLGVELVEGRWFDETDAANPDRVVLINERLRAQLFGDENPIGVDIRNRSEHTENPEIGYRVIGVFRDFRQRGELAELRNYTIGRFPIEDKEQRALTMLVKVQPGLDAGIEEDLQSLIQGIARNWVVTVTSLESLKRIQNREVILPLTVAGLVAGFLLLMVAFGLFGVLWQNVTRRTDELGLRRAVGATRHRIYRQIVGEILVLALLAVAAGSLIGIQFPMLGTFSALNWQSAIEALLVGGALIGALCLVCALYPAWLASKRSPADALHYE